MRIADEATRRDTARAVGGSREAGRGAHRGWFRLSFGLGADEQELQMANSETKSANGRIPCRRQRKCSWIHGVVV